ncbi:hypothetical protein Dcar01_00533 [Deinococcus carri]|uniref:FecR protein domain-containing protein n=1 Tax=Deinococcus carri TaxID=1211323 RepID=A0ABP9W5T4_9DEIO
MRADARFPALPLRPALAALLLGSGLLAGAQGAPLTVQQALGRVEVQDSSGTWRAVSGSTPVRLGLRTASGTPGGRAWLASTAGGRSGTLLVGPGSQLRVSQGEADLRGGQFLLGGPVGVHVLGNHLVLERGAQARVDLADGTRRVALLGGSARLALGSRVVRLGAGQQVALKTGQVTPFAETDPWYAAAFTGPGSATVQATRGPVYVASGGTRKIAGVGEVLQTGERLTTGGGAWAEVGFSGGGYLRLQAQSELTVRGNERTARGPETTLQLTRGSAWNVVSSTQAAPASPAIGSTAARGSVFQVEAGRLVRVFGGQTGTAGAVLAGTPGPSNPALDAERAQPLTLVVDPVTLPLRDLTLSAVSLPAARVTAQMGRRSFPLTSLGGGRFRLDTAPGLTEGPHTVVVRAEWRGQVRTRTLRVTLDRTPPVLSDLGAEQAGSLLTVSGTVRDEEAGTDRASVGVTVDLGGESFSRTVALTGGSGTFQFPLPAPAPGTPVRLTVRDAAGNEAHAVLP